jgi:4-alpha-glucanotransferase
MKRSAGVLLHPTSLPGPFGVGDLGPGARDYVRWLGLAGASWWQILPLHPPGPGNSPYSALSTYAGNPLLISPEDLVSDGLLTPEEIADHPAVDDPHRVDFESVRPWKEALLRRAWERASSRAGILARIQEFEVEHRSWLPDFALFRAIRAERDGQSWTDWPESLRRREPAALASAREEHADAIALEVFTQYVFFRQWMQLRRDAAGNGVRILGDVPIFVALDSADVWSHAEIFKLDDDLQPVVVAGVPPDYFSATGQLWGNPLYDWERLKDDDYAWWIARLGHAVTLADAVRLDHFRGFQAAWEVPADETVATNGSWVPGPGHELFDAVRKELGGLPLVAEDLGEITDDVIALRTRLGLPGMAILQFAFCPKPRSSFIPYRHDRDLVVYTGTHDNNTTVGWFENEASAAEKNLFLSYAGGDLPPHWAMIRLALASVADTAIVPHQDLVGAGGGHRMNRPGVGEGNWAYRITPDDMGHSVRSQLKELIHVFGRHRD